MTRTHAFGAELFVWDAHQSSSWFFLALPQDVSDELRLEAGEPRGFGSVRVEVTVGGSTWSTSVFPSTELGVFVLPVKKAVRTAEDLQDGAQVDVRLRALG